MICETFNELFTQAAKAIMSTDALEQPEAYEKIRDGTATRLMKICEQNFEQNPLQNYIACDDMTIADFCLSAFLFNFVKNDASPLQPILKPLLMKYPNFAAYSKRLEKEFSVHLQRRPKLAI